jgi:hypothetical protein
MLCSQLDWKTGNSPCQADGSLTLSAVLYMISPVVDKLSPNIVHVMRGAVGRASAAKVTPVVSEQKHG